MRVSKVLLNVFLFDIIKSSISMYEYIYYGRSYEKLIFMELFLKEKSMGHAI